MAPVFLEFYLAREREVVSVSLRNAHFLEFRLAGVGRGDTAGAVNHDLAQKCAWEMPSSCTFFRPGGEGKERGGAGVGVRISNFS